MSCVSKRLSSSSSSSSLLLLVVVVMVFLLPFVGVFVSFHDWGIFKDDETDGKGQDDDEEENDAISSIGLGSLDFFVEGTTRQSSEEDDDDDDDDRLFRLGILFEKSSPRRALMASDRSWSMVALNSLACNLRPATASLFPFLPKVKSWMDLVFPGCLCSSPL